MSKITRSKFRFEKVSVIGLSSTQLKSNGRRVYVYPAYHSESENVILKSINDNYVDFEFEPFAIEKQVLLEKMRSIGDIIKNNKGVGITTSNATEIISIIEK